MSSTGGVTARQGTATFAMGDPVQVHSLVSEAGAALNGQYGRIVGRNMTTGRWRVSVQGIAEGKQLKECNLCLAAASSALSSSTVQIANEISKTEGKAKDQHKTCERAVQAGKNLDSVRDSELRPDRVEVLGAGHGDANGSYIWTADKQRYYKDSGREDGDFYTINPPGVKEAESRLRYGWCPPEDMNGMNAFVQYFNKCMDDEEKHNSRGWTLRLLSQRGNASDIYVAPGSAAAPPPVSGWECTRLLQDLRRPAPTLRLC